ncbi:MULTISPECIES: hypothetical protein [unclassified Bradyrhizobium]|jgi:hypothetical protein|uniref:Uncharacterized protein n=1 Tax=Bradyrhizobium sp. LLZ17 TaxID=3239388 RepID=A0AB39XI97_9BRAD
MDLKIDGIAVGERLTVSKLGTTRCPELAGKVGVVVAKSSHTTSIIVLFDGAQ